ncbi:extracellular solute-binding protein [Treponema sp. Marseille-Q4130]|uniref:extracellular solute-binding protein n=1 Tax=Treponema sp. Marseille-Q4130 TaxID=2766702 RepID=UPI001651B7D4|nr:extracellular solute-binding protein [Treponema sp. Marseille-Q4130]MBC6719259.1 extracellular solute-binding protein [Treponema sp. Marseille-Q4130]
MRTLYRAFLFFVAFFVFTGCFKKAKGGDDSNTLVVASPHPLVLIVPVIENFENETGIDVELVQGGTKEILKTLQMHPDSSPYDVLWGGSYASVLPASSLFDSYTSENEPYIKGEYKNVEGMLNRFSDVPSVLMINKKRLGDVALSGYGDLLNPKLKGAIAFGNPETSSSAWEHLINMLYAAGKGNPDDGWDYVKRLCGNLDGILLNSSSAVYNGVADGRFAVGLTFEEGGANFAEKDDNIALVYMNEGVVFTPDGVYMPKKIRHKDNAVRFIDYVTGKNVQSYIAKQMNRRSVRNDVETKSLLPAKSGINSISVDYAYTTSHQSEWVERFFDIFENARQSDE